MKITDLVFALAAFSAGAAALLLAHYAAPLVRLDFGAYSLVAASLLCGTATARWLEARYLLTSPRLPLVVVIALAWILTLAVPALYWATAAKSAANAILIATAVLAFALGVPAGLARGRLSNAAAIAGILAPLWLVPQFGFFRLCAFLGSLHAGLSLVIALGRHHSDQGSRAERMAAALTCVVAGTLFITGDVLRQTMEWRLLAVGNPSTIVYGETSPRQSIVLTEEKETNPFFPGAPQHVLYLDGKVRFNSRDEQARYSCLASVPLAAVATGSGPARSALVLGGGDGMVARNLVAAPRLKKVVVVESDRSLVRLAQEEMRLRMYNHDSLRNAKVELVVDEPFHWARSARGSFDLIILDLPYRESKLLTAELFSSLLRLLSPDGVLALSSRDPLRLASFRETLSMLGKESHVYAVAGDSESFLFTARKEFEASAFFKRQGACLPTQLKSTGEWLTFNSVPASKKNSASP